MPLVMLSANALKSLTGNNDVAGAILLTYFRACIASGFWEQFGAGDGIATFTTTTTDIFTAGTGYKTSGTWASVLANSVSNPLAWMCIREKASGGGYTGRMMAFQRGSGTALGNDRFNVFGFSRAGWSGTPSATVMFPTGTYYSVWGPGPSATFGSAGHSFITNGSAYLGGGTGTTTNYNIWVTDAYSAQGIASNAVEWTQAASWGSIIAYEALKTAPADTDPYMTIGGEDLFGVATLGSSTVAWATSGTVACQCYDRTTTLRRAVFDKFNDAVGTVRPPSTTPISIEAGSTYPIFPIQVSCNSATAAFKGVCENFEQVMVGGINWMNRATFHASVLDPVEKARLSLGNACLPWAVGLGAVPSTPGNKTDVRAAQPTTVVDSTAPTVGAFTPAAGAISATQTITIPVTDTSPGLVKRVKISIDYSSPDRHEIAFDGLSVVGGYDADYLGSTVSAIANGYQYVVVPVAGWRGAMSVRVTVTDSSGNVTEGTPVAYTQTVSNVPTTTSVTPANASAVAYNVAPTFRNSAPTGMLRELIWVYYVATGVRELVYASSVGFQGIYSTSSRSVVLASKTFDYTIVRTGGFPYAPTFVSECVNIDAISSSTSWVYTISTSPNPAAPDIVAPVIGAFVPAAGAIAYNQSIVVPVTDAEGNLSKYVVTIQFAGQPDETVWDGFVFSSDYSVGSSAANISNGKSLTIIRNVGWPSAFTAKVSARDAAGNEATPATSAYTITGANPAAPDAADPVVGSVLPAAGPVSPTQAITGQVTDDKLLTRYTISVYFTSLLREETVWDGTSYSTQYLAGSSRLSIDALGGYSFSVVRTGGWIDDFTFKVKPVDAAGKVADFSRGYTVNTVVIPNISDISPAPGGAFTPNTTVSFKLRAPAGAAAMVVLAKFENLDRTEVIWTNTVFAENYIDDSSMTPSGLLGGDFVVRRLDGWPDVPIFETLVVDKYGRVT